jgi:hypothetical protein
MRKAEKWEELGNVSRMLFCTDFHNLAIFSFSENFKNMSFFVIFSNFFSIFQNK